MSKVDPTPSPEKIQSAWKQFLEEKGLSPDSPVIYNNQQTELVNRNTKGVSAWLESPANLKLLARAYKALIKIARQRKMDVGEVKAVRAARLGNSDVIFIFPVPEDEPQAIVCQFYSDHHWVNLRSLLEESDRLLPVRHNKRFVLREVGSDSPVGPALVFDLSAAVEHTVDKQTTTKSAPKPDQAAAGE